jgi:hypothetical protein
LVTRRLIGAVYGKFRQNYNSLMMR